MERLAYTVDQAREQLGGISRPTIYVWINEGQLGSVKVGGRRFITHDQITKFLANHEVTECSSS